jgi:hypothetical protein
MGQLELQNRLPRFNSGRGLQDLAKAAKSKSTISQQTHGLMARKEKPQAPLAASSGGQSSARAELTLTPKPVTIVPTPYPADPAAPLVISGYVRIDVRSAEFGELNAKLDELIRLVGQSNQIAGETRDQLFAEIQAGRTILAAPKPDRNLIEALLVHSLTWIVAAAGSGIIGECANEALHLLLRMLETPISL